MEDQSTPRDCRDNETNSITAKDVACVVDHNTPSFQKRVESGGVNFLTKHLHQNLLNGYR